MLPGFPGAMTPGPGGMTPGFGGRTPGFGGGTPGFGGRTPGIGGGTPGFGGRTPGIGGGTPGFGGRTPGTGGGTPGFGGRTPGFGGGTPGFGGTPGPGQERYLPRRGLDPGQEWYLPRPGLGNEQYGDRVWCDERYGDRVRWDVMSGTEIAYGASRGDDTSTRRGYPSLRACDAMRGTGGAHHATSIRNVAYSTTYHNTQCGVLPSRIAVPHAPIWGTDIVQDSEQGRQGLRVSHSHAGTGSVGTGMEYGSTGHVCTERGYAGTRFAGTGILHGVLDILELREGVGVPDMFELTKIMGVPGQGGRMGHVGGATPALGVGGMTPGSCRYQPTRVLCDVRY
eukprot:692188-Rhodomonas_salina.1